MAITTFDTLEFVRKLERVGVPSEQAEVQAQVLTEALNVNLESLVTKEFLESRLDARFAEQNAHIDIRFAELKSGLDTRLDTRIAELKSEFETRLQVQTALLGIILLSVVIQLLERLFTL